eukprot:9432626-Pyramimonas_sp.AAC.1
MPEWAQGVWEAISRRALHPGGLGARMQGSALELVTISETRSGCGQQRTNGGSTVMSAPLPVGQRSVNGRSTVGLRRSTVGQRSVNGRSTVNGQRSRVNGALTVVGQRSVNGRFTAVNGRSTVGQRWFDDQMRRSTVGERSVNSGSVRSHSKPKACLPKSRANATANL